MSDDTLYIPVHIMSFHQYSSMPVCQYTSIPV